VPITLTHVLVLAMEELVERVDGRQSVEVGSFGGDVVIHSSVRASHGSSGAAGALRCVSTTLMRNMRMPTARMKAPIDATRFQNPRLKNPPPARYSLHTYIRRGCPCSPMMCIGPNVMFMPMIISQKFHRPSSSLRHLPKTFGHQ